MAHVDYHLKLEGIDGESTHKDHKGEIQLLSWHWGVSNAHSSAGTGGSGKGKAVPLELSFIHLYDKSSPILAKHCANGKHVNKGTLTCRKAGEGQKDYLKIELKEVFITAVNLSGSSEEPTESVNLSYKEIDVEYKPQDDKGGLGGGVKFGWNVATTEVK